MKKLPPPPFRLGATALTLSSLLLLASCATQTSFQTADTDQSGGISPAEFETHMLDAIFSAADANGDGVVTAAESKKANPSSDPAKFNKADRNHDGNLTPGEVKSHFARQGTMKDLFRQIDTNGDGSLDEAEVKAYYAKMQKQAGSTDLEKLSNTLKK